MLSEKTNNMHSRHKNVLYRDKKKDLRRYRINCRTNSVSTLRFPIPTSWC